MPSEKDDTTISKMLGAIRLDHLTVEELHAFSEVCNDLAFLAHHKAWAWTAERNGELSATRLHEKQIEEAYNRLPAWMLGVLPRKNGRAKTWMSR